MDKVIVTTGGTGGHIFPAMAIIEQLYQENPDAQILFIGGTKGQEKEIASKANIPFEALPSQGFLGKGFKSIPAAISILKSIFLAAKIIGQFKPQIIIGCGGYASFAPVLAGIFKKIPCLLHEQNAIAGSSNKILERFGAKVCTSLPETQGFTKNTYLTGNPVRKCFLKNIDKEFGKSKNLLILGGSQGAHSLNEFIIKFLPELKKNNIRIMHQTGKNDIAKLKKEYEKNGIPSDCVKDFIFNMEGAYAWADLVFCRAGASTIAELCVTGTPAVFVPFPQAIHDHQTQNARRLVEANAAYLVDQKELSLESTGNLLLNLLNDTEKLKDMSASMKRLAHPEAAKKIVKIMNKLVEKSFL